jgi:hypothetical protein
MRCLFAAALILAVSPNLSIAQTLGDPDAAPTTSDGAATLPYGLFISPAISTLGLGVEGGMRLNDSFGLRLGGNWLALEDDGSQNDFAYDADLTLASFGTLVDYHPFQGGFRVTGGLRYNFNDLEVVGNATDIVTIGDVEFSPEEVGTVSGDVGFNVVAPYLGIGYGATLLEGAFSIGFDLGLMVHGQADVQLESEDGDLSGTDLLNDSLDDEERNIEDDLDAFVVYPVVGLAAIYRF